MLNRALHLAAFVGSLCITALACAPSVETGSCDADTPCAGRGQACDLMTSTCMAVDPETDSTDETSPASFSGLAVPFFRGQICLPHEVKSGATIPVSLSPCLHPCLAPTSFEFKHFFSCVGSSCDAYATMWVVADSVADGCPADAFARFDSNMCSYPMDPVNFGIATSLDSGPISGSMLLEVPFLSNADIAQISEAGNDQALFESLVFQYPQDNGRVPDGRSIQLLPDHAEPPETCNGTENCSCFDIGF